LLAVDRLFSLLEPDFSTSDIERAVGAALKPKDDVDLSAHRILLDLSRDAQGKPRLVTTNFDLLFEAADPKVLAAGPNDLPDIGRDASFDGIVHLHGRFDSN